MRPVTKVAVLALAGALTLTGCSAVSQDAIEAEQFAQSTLDDPKIPIGPGSTLDVRAFEWGFEVQGVAVDGPVQINFNNVGGATHNFRIDNAAGEVKKVEAVQGAEAEGELLLFGGGEYTYYCDISGHRTQGMVGTLKVLLPGEEPAETEATPSPTDEVTPSETETAAPTVDDLDDSDDVAGALDARGLARLYKVSFSSGSADLDAAAGPVLDQMADYLNANASANFRIEGNTDSTGSDEANQSLSQERAESVVAALIERGIDQARLTAVGNGSSNPIIEDEQSDQDQLVNRRVEVHLA